MEIKISFKHLEMTPALNDRIHEKSQKIAKYLGNKTLLKWTCEVKEGDHHADLRLIGPKFEYHAHASAGNLYKAFDLVIGKMETQIHKKKEKMRNKISKKNIPVKNVEICEPEIAWADYDEDRFDDVA